MHNDANLRIGSDIDEEEIDLNELLGVVLENRWLIVVITAVVFLFGAYQAFVAVPVYKADALLQVEESKTNVGYLEVNNLIGSDTLVSAEMEILKSRSVLAPVVDILKLDMNAEPAYFSAFTAALAQRSPADEKPRIQVDTMEMPDSLIGTGFQLIAQGSDEYELLDELGESLGRGKVGETLTVVVAGAESLSLFVSVLKGEPGQEYDLWRSSRLSATLGLQGSLSIEEQGEWSGILKISVTGTDREAVQMQVNEIANVYVRQNVERRSVEAQQTLDFLDQQLPSVRAEVEAAEYALNNYRLEKGSIDLPAETQSVLQTIVSIEEQLNKLRQEREKVTLAFTPIHPTVVALDRQIEQLNNDLENMNSQVRDLPTTQQELIRLTRDVEVSMVLYTSLLNTAQELRVVKAGTVGNARIVDYAAPPGRPISPNVRRMLLISLVLGGFLGVAAAFGRKALQVGVEDPDKIEKQVGIPVYATIAHSKRQDELYESLSPGGEKPAVLASDSPDDIAIESLRNLQTALHFGMMDAKNNCIMIAGPSPAVGKSFTSVNLAAVLTNNGKKVLLIDGDMRQGHLHKFLGVTRENGLSDFIGGTISIEQALHATSVPGLTLMPTGNLPPNPAELLLHERFDKGLSELISRYDHVIIDSPPILAATDASIIGQMAGATLMVVKAGEHPMREIEQSVKRLQRSGVNLRGLLINDIKLGRRYGSGRYAYQYAYKK